MAPPPLRPPPTPSASKQAGDGAQSPQAVSRRLALVLAAGALLGFAANSLLARAALADPSEDPAIYTLVRCLAAAVTLGLLECVRARRVPLLGGSWASGTALAVYALAFALAYARVGAAAGALVLFAAVQATMLSAGIARGERPGARGTIGLVVAFGAFVWLLLPGLDQPDPVGALLMAVSGAAWGIYSLRGRSSVDATRESGGNFLRASLCCGVALLVLGPASGAASERALGLAVLSGSVSSALAYILWYRALPRLGASEAATLQLLVPPMTAFGAAALLAEPPTLRLVVATLLILGGVALTIRAPASRSG